MNTTRDTEKWRIYLAVFIAFVFWGSLIGYPVIMLIRTWGK